MEGDGLQAMAPPDHSAGVHDGPFIDHGIDTPRSCGPVLSGGAEELPTSVMIVDPGLRGGPGGGGGGDGEAHHEEVQSESVGPAASALSPAPSLLPADGPAAGDAAAHDATVSARQAADPGERSEPQVESTHSPHDHAVRAHRHGEHVGSSHRLSLLRLTWLTCPLSRLLSINHCSCRCRESGRFAGLGYSVPYLW